MSRIGVLAYTVMLSGLLLHLAGSAVVPLADLEPADHAVVRRSADQQSDLLLLHALLPAQGAIPEDSVVRKVRSPTKFGGGGYYKGGGRPYGGGGGCGGQYCGGCGGGCGGGGGGGGSYSKSQSSSSSGSYGGKK